MMTPLGVTDWTKFFWCAGVASAECTLGRTRPTRSGANVDGRRPRREVTDMTAEGRVGNYANVASGPSIPRRCSSRLNREGELPLYLLSPVGLVSIVRHLAEIKKISQINLARR